MKILPMRTAVLALLCGFLALASCRKEQKEQVGSAKKPEIGDSQAGIRGEAGAQFAQAKPRPAAKAPTKAAEKAPAKPAEAEPASPPGKDPVVAEAPEQAEQEGEEPGAETNSEMQLLGIIRASGQPSSAIIEYRGSQEVFRKGEAVFDQGTLRDVRENSVLIRSGKKDVKLELRRTAADAAPPTPEAQVVDAKPPTEVEPAPPPMNRPIPRAEARAALQSLSQALEEAEAERVPVAGSHGVVLKTVPPTSFFAKLGLKSGDILQKLNGSLVDDPKNLPDLSGAADRAELTVSFVRSDVGLTVSRPLQ